MEWPLHSRNPHHSRGLAALGGAGRTISPVIGVGWLAAGGSPGCGRQEPQSLKR